VLHQWDRLSGFFENGFQSSLLKKPDAAGLKRRNERREKVVEWVDGCDLCPEGTQGCMAPLRVRTLGKNGAGAGSASSYDLADLAVDYPAGNLCPFVRLGAGVPEPRERLPQVPSWIPCVSYAYTLALHAARTDSSHVYHMTALLRIFRERLSALTSHFAKTVTRRENMLGSTAGAQQPRAKLRALTIGPTATRPMLIAAALTAQSVNKGASA
jgi:hypothetical protein